MNNPDNPAVCRTRTMSDAPPKCDATACQVLRCAGLAPSQQSSLRTISRYAATLHRTQPT